MAISAAELGALLVFIFFLIVITILGLFLKYFLELRKSIDIVMSAFVTNTPKSKLSSYAIVFNYILAVFSGLSALMTLLASIFVQVLMLNPEIAQVLKEVYPSGVSPSLMVIPEALLSVLGILATTVVYLLFGIMMSRYNKDPLLVSEQVSVSPQIPADGYPWMANEVEQVNQVPQPAPPMQEIAEDLSFDDE
jgi:hypothetical protein